MTSIPHLSLLKRHLPLQGHWTTAISFIYSRPTSQMTTTTALIGRCKICNDVPIVNDLVTIQANKYLVAIGSQTRGHKTQFLHPFSRVQAFKNQLFPSAIMMWKTLSDEIVSRAFGLPQPLRVRHVDSSQIITDQLITAARKFELFILKCTLHRSARILNR